MFKRARCIGLLVAWAALCNCIALLRPASAAEITCVYRVHDRTGDAFSREYRFARPQQNFCTDLLIRGQIATGDTERLRRLILENAGWVNEVHLNSNGGLISEAIELGRHIRRYHVETAAPSYHWTGGVLFNPTGPGHQPDLCTGEACSCESACFLIWAGGVRRTGTRLGLHRPYLPPDVMRGLSASRAQQIYAQLLSEIRQYFIDVQMSLSIFEIMVSIPSNSVIAQLGGVRYRNLGGITPKTGHARRMAQSSNPFWLCSAGIESSWPVGASLRRTQLSSYQIRLDSLTVIFFGLPGFRATL